MLSNGSETYRKSRTDFAGIVKNELDFIYQVCYNYNIPKIIGTGTIIRRVSNMELTQENYNKLKDNKLKRSEIAKIFNIPEWKLKKHIATYKWGKILPIIEFEDVFEELDEYSCYWGGFLAADGNVDSKKRVRLMLQYDDMGHLEKFKELIGSTHTISYNTDQYNRCSFEFTSRKMCEDLERNFNIVPNKTDKLKFPKHLTVEQLRHYIRGYFDGDGSICESFSNKNSITATLYTTFASGYKEHIDNLFEFLQQELQLVGNNRDYGTKSQLKFNTNDSITILSWMYSNCNIYLDRKYAKYQEILVKGNRLTRVLDKGIVQSS